MTLDGTNTWVLLEPGSHGGASSSTPARSTRATSQPVARRASPPGAPGWRRRSSPTATPTTPRPRPRFAELTGAPARAVGRGHDDLGDGDVRDGRRPRAARRRHARATPSDSLSFALPADHALLTGDTVLGRGTTVVAHPDGELAAYLASLERIARAHRRRRGDRDPARARAGRAGRRGDGRVLPHAPRASGSSRCAQALADGAARRTPVRPWSSGCTPTCPARSGRRRG